MDFEKSVRMEIESYIATGLRSAAISRLDSVRKALAEVLPYNVVGWRIQSVTVHEDRSLTVEVISPNRDSEAVVYLNNDGTPSSVVTDHPAYQTA